VTDTHPQPGLVAEAFAGAQALGIHPLAIDTPFGVGTVNTYLIEDDPLTLVDCGPNTATALDQLESLLTARGRRITDLEQVVVTHQHADHMGLAGTVARRSGAELVTLDRLAPLAADWETVQIQSDDDARALMLRHGVEPHVAEALRAVANITRSFAASASVDRTVSDGGELQLAERTFEVFHRPGHSPSDTVLYDRANRIAILGDHLIRHISSNAVIDRPLDRPLSEPITVRPEPLLEYRRSLRATRELDFDVGLTGHGLPVTDHVELIGKRLRAHEHRAETMYKLLADGPRSAHELATLRWGGRVAVTQAFLTLSEVLGHLGMLLEDGRIIEDRSADVIVFEQAA
jgi:glyoxylase-like metal-dependent hydrolase (beta-lactamase superfamily II)